ncbi:MAG: hypothetical protein AB1598_13895 [Thermodesulfobacteriota bacterium]
MNYYNNYMLKICTECHYIGYGKNKITGFAFGGYPGIVGQAKKFPPEQLDNVCPICEKKSLIPTDSPRGKLLIKELDFKVDEE